MEEWESITEDRLILSVIQEGFLIPFVSSPPLTNVPIVLSSRHPAMSEVVSSITSDKEYDIEGSQPPFLGFLQPSVPRSEERRPMEAGDRLVDVECVYPGREVQDGNVSFHQERYPGRRLGGFFTPNRCL